MQADDFGKTFTGAGGYRYKIVGLKTRSKYPVIAERLPKVGQQSDGKRFKFPVETINRVFGRKLPTQIVTDHPLNVRPSVRAMEETEKFK